ncbi:hypothetical protein BDV96DRAFT_595453 [Lophiotrema nucula]|uniref:Uncharacterized protein n=1 Tax=Lophiotrema nucula TaxID=690887 RepID=A0A6A5ZJL0_9PLEO|nr:hypothetical protein BDV96DRAFT_595453 [Lophiotrema nucula]
MACTLTVCAGIFFYLNNIQHIAKPEPSTMPPKKAKHPVRRSSRLKALKNGDTATPSPSNNVIALRLEEIEQMVTERRTSLVPVLTGTNIACSPQRKSRGPRWAQKRAGTGSINYYRNWDWGTRAGIPGCVHVFYLEESLNGRIRHASLVALLFYDDICGIVIPDVVCNILVLKCEDIAGENAPFAGPANPISDYTNLIALLP